MIEGFFSKMTKQMLGGIRVEIKKELEDRIYKYFDEINKEPVPYKWTYNMPKCLILDLSVSVAKGLDVDKPRNLAKSVTVE